MRRAGAMAAAAMLGLAVAGCAGSTTSGGGYGSATNKGAADGTASTAAPRAAGGPLQVTMANIAFSPTQTTAKVGQPVQWTNQDGVPHNVTATKGATFKSKDLQPGQGYSYKPVRPGTIRYMCTIHPQMVASIQVIR